MSRLSERDIARKLAEREDLEPPAGLLDRIKSEIPPTVISVVPGPSVPERRSAMPVTQRWLIAASLIAAVGAGVFALRVQQQAPEMVDMAMEEAPASAPAPQRQSRPAEPEAAPEAALEQAMADEDTAAVERKDSPASIPPPPPPPPAPQAMKEELQRLGYIGPANEVDAEAVMVPEPVQPMEVADGVEGGRVTGVVGGVVGGVAGGAPGGVPSAPAPANAPKQRQREQQSMA
ncbi:MAG TPA: hypothetical protein VG477_09170 [Thermoanaerobaculia bacterium]|nr:hypothetical protein [Thermoanaerobaculia bacterium]